MPEIIIADTSCLIALTNINELQLLHKLYGHIFTTREVADEFINALPAWINIKEIINKHLQVVLENEIDKGEASAIALAIEQTDAILILDDYKARKIAIRLGLKLTGTVGIIVKAKKAGFISSIQPLLNRLKTNHFHISPQLEEIALKQAGEK
jgi:predicted nucleic acid-binding protein